MKATSALTRDGDDSVPITRCPARATFWGAVAALTRAIELDGDNPHQPHSWLLLAMSNWQVDQKDKAREWYAKAISWWNKNESEITEKLTILFGEAANQIGSAPSGESGSTA